VLDACSLRRFPTALCTTWAIQKSASLQSRTSDADPGSEGPEMNAPQLRSNISIDMDAQRRPRAARAPVGRRSSLRYAS
jgi:hypothetical protein